MCGSKYSDSVSHTQKISNLLDKINTAILSEMNVDCVCCESLDISKLDIINLSVNTILITKTLEFNHKIFYAPNVKTLIPYLNQIRAPPIS